MKAFLASMFFKGALMNDPDGVPREQGPNSRSARRIEFTSVDDVTRFANTTTTHVAEAIGGEDAGSEAGPPPALVLVEEFQARFDQEPALKAAFEALTPGRRREYNLHFSDAKQAKTRLARIDRYAPKILDGRGIRNR